MMRSRLAQSIGSHMRLMNGGPFLSLSPRLLLLIISAQKKIAMADLQLLSAAAATSCGYATFMPPLICTFDE